MSERRAGPRTALLWALVAILGLAASQRLADGFLQLVWLPAPPVDLQIRWREIHAWFAGQPVYRDNFAVYPPASFVMLWPALGWVDPSGARRVWGLTTLASLGWLSWLAARESGGSSVASRLVAGLLPLAIYPTRAVMVNGQLALHLLPALVAGLLLLARRPPTWTRDVGATALLLIALTKPTLTAPFMWIITTVRGSLRALVLVGVGYAALTALAISFQPQGAATLVRQFMHGAAADSAGASAHAHANLHSWITALGIGWGYTLASLAVLAALGWWIYRAEDSELWIRLGIAGLVARFWTFHYRYDDVLVLLPMVALLRMVTRQEAGAPLDRGAATLLVLISISVLIPARLLFPPWPWQAIESAQTVIWLAALGFLIVRSRTRGDPRGL